MSDAPPQADQQQPDLGTMFFMKAMEKRPGVPPEKLGFYLQNMGYFVLNEYKAAREAGVKDMFIEVLPGKPGTDGQPDEPGEVVLLDPRAFVISDHKKVERDGEVVLSENKEPVGETAKPAAYEAMLNFPSKAKALLGITAVDPVWAILRQVTEGIFKGENLKLFREQMKGIAEEVIASRVYEGATIDVTELTTIYTMKVLFQTLFGTNVLRDSDFTPEKRYENGQLNISEKEAFELARALVNGTVFTLLCRAIDEDPENFPGSEIAYHQNVNLVVNVIEEMIKLYRENPDKNTGVVNITSNTVSALDEKRISYGELINSFASFYEAGSTTSSNWLATALLQLSQHPEWAKRIANDENGVDTKLFLNEALRVGAVVPNLQRITTQDITLPDGSVIKAGTNIHFSIIGFNNDDTLWTNRATAEFAPEKHFDTKGNALVVYPGTFVPFGGAVGKHGGFIMCAGKPLGEQESWVFVDVLAKKLEEDGLKLDLPNGKMPEYHDEGGVNAPKDAKLNVVKA